MNLDRNPPYVRHSVALLVLALIFGAGCVTAPRREHPRSASLFVYVHIVAPPHPRPPAQRLDAILPQSPPTREAFNVDIMPGFNSDQPGTLTVYVAAVGTDYRFTNTLPLTRGHQIRLLGMDTIDQPVPAFHIGGVRAQYNDDGLSPVVNFDCEEVEEWDGLAYACHVVEEPGEGSKPTAPAADTASAARAGDARQPVQIRIR